MTPAPSPAEQAREALRTQRAAPATPSPPAPTTDAAPVPDAARPADVAREALRTTNDSGGAGAAPEEHSGDTGGDAAATTARPADVARRALRERPGGRLRSEGAPESLAPSGSPGHEPAAADADDARRRPADVAREALRAARQGEDEAASADGPPRGVRPEYSAQDPTPPGTGTHTGADARAGGGSGMDARTGSGSGGGTGFRPGGGSGPGVGSRSGVGVRTGADARGAKPGTDVAAGELRRTFAGRVAGVERSGAGDAGSWWGRAWVAALEDSALDQARLARGRTYARQGLVDAITVTPGQVLAYVHGSRPRPYRTRIELPTLSDAEWDQLLDTATERPGHIAALLDKELPRSLARGGGADLLPGPGDLEPYCSCPDSGHPCKHAAALCYETARLLDEDPFVLLLLRGRGERQLLDDLSRRNATLAARADQDENQPRIPGVRATDALAPRTPPPLPTPMPPLPHPEQPPVYPAAPGGPDPLALDQLATDAAARAHALLRTGEDPVAGLTLWQDAVRLAAARPGSGLTATTRTLYAALASATGRTATDLARAVAAWRQGGQDGLTVLEEPWDPPAGPFDQARPALRAAEFPAFRPTRNRLTHPRGHLQLRLGHDGHWYAYESEPGREDWWPRGTPDRDPVGALSGLLTG
ncbi:SWIM zinc finger family protein [Streptomyces apocyni]|uniref:SWIM zinc finger family protein n=1 Tax=Streptomyces apocyni TaxID=2654677 RepID=UPI0012EA667E|nr:SWIM zinc finger family protein [Streptomyces apocyni]